MNTFVWLHGKNGVLFALNYAHIETVDETADETDAHTEIRMVSGQVVHVQNSVEQIMQMVPV